MKLAGSKKLQGFCPGEMTVREKKIDGTCLVRHQKKHIGHDVNDSANEMPHVYLTDFEKRDIARQIKGNKKYNRACILALNYNYCVWVFYRSRALNV